MSDDRQEQLERRLRAAARNLAYPPTPDLVAALRQRRGRRWGSPRLPSPAALVLVALAIAGALLLAVPQVRAAALEALRIGVVRIIPAAPQPAPTAAPTRATDTSQVAATASPLTSAPTATRARPDPLRDLRGATTLEEARERLPFPLRLPSEPPGLGPPDAVFVQDLGGPAAILVWREPADPGKTRLALYVLSSHAFAQKVDVPALEETMVGSQRAVWTSGPYVLQLGGGRDMMDIRRLVTGHTLIWADGDLTYRLETELPLAAAVKVAESLR